MTPNEYIKWIASRPANPADWNYTDCKAADACIKKATLENLSAYLKKQGIDGSLSSWIIDLASFHFGSMETDHMLMALNLYPEWMKGR